MILIKKWANITTIKKGKILYLYFKVFLTSGNSFNYHIPRDKVAHLLGVKTDDKGAVEMARRSRGTPRLANRLLKRV